MPLCKLFVTRNPCTPAFLCLTRLLSRATRGVRSGPWETPPAVLPRFPGWGLCLSSAFSSESLFPNRCSLRDRITCRTSRRDVAGCQQSGGALRTGVLAARREGLSTFIPLL